MGRTGVFALLMVLCAFAGGISAPAVAGAPAMGLTDDPAFASLSADVRASALKTADRAGARFVRITLDWSRVAPEGQVKPAGFDGTDPYDQRYRWDYIDDAVRDATRAGFDVVLVVARAPAWAEGPSRPAGAPAGSWRPDPNEFAAFMRAATRHFSGFFPDYEGTGDGITGRGQALPEVRYWQIWHEPNGGRTLLPARDAVEQYRRLLKGAGTAADRLGRRTKIVAGGTVPGGAMSALPFWRKLLCLDRAGRRAECPEKARFDVALHDPSTRQSPRSRRPARDLGFTHLSTLRDLLGRAASLRTVRPARPKPLWVGGVSWGVSRLKEARYLVEALFFSDRARAGLFAPDRLQEGTPAFQAYRFPFLVHATGGRFRAWGVAPRAGPVIHVEVRGKRGWHPVVSIADSRNREFGFRVPNRRGVYRARQGRAKSLPWRF